MILGGSQEAAKRHPGGTQEAPKAPEGILRPDLIKMVSLSWEVFVGNSWGIRGRFSWRAFVGN